MAGVGRFVKCNNVTDRRIGSKHANNRLHMASQASAPDFRNNEEHLAALREMDELSKKVS